ncbi:hypothetical protein J7I98_31380 [Streptomyces sp. ISL-98]|uniref:hypothetical protein n=1 Tax=Streptomyces sp. ISL-98 TaxID=2819192 RepID=UPI001BEACEE0|nr:hypothetical protein [Streptomyces sp. ISL-98]MBT2510279.1 hypothetical protein [Streptomyces sp. ISL-98]
MHEEKCYNSITWTRTGLLRDRWDGRELPDGILKGVRTTSYRLRRGPWGIAIDLTAAPTLTLDPPSSGEQVGERVWLDAAPVGEHVPADRSGVRLTPEELPWLRRGMALLTGDIEAAHGQTRHTLVTVHRVLFPEADFQPEGLAAALLQWGREEFGLDTRPVEVTFDREANRYVYPW